MATFLIVTRPEDGLGKGSVTAFNIERVQGIHMDIGTPGVFITVSDPSDDPEDGPEHIDTKQCWLSSGEDVLAAMTDAKFMLEREKRKGAKDGATSSE